MEENKKTTEIEVKLKKFRKLSKIKQKELAKIVGITPATMRAWENKPEIVPLGKFFALAAAMGVPAERLFAEESEEKNE